MGARRTVMRAEESIQTNQVSSGNAPPSACVGVIRYCASVGDRSTMVCSTAFHFRSAAAKGEFHGCNNQPRRVEEKNRWPGKLHTNGNARAHGVRAGAFAGSGECAARASAGACAETGSEERRRDRGLLRKPDMTRLRSCLQGSGGNGIYKREGLRGWQIGLDRRRPADEKQPFSLAGAANTVPVDSYA